LLTTLSQLREFQVANKQIYKPTNSSNSADDGHLTIYRDFNSNHADRRHHPTNQEFTSC